MYIGKYVLSENLRLPLSHSKLADIFSEEILASSYITGKMQKAYFADLSSPCAIVKARSKNTRRRHNGISIDFAFSREVCKNFFFKISLFREKICCFIPQKYPYKLLKIIAIRKITRHLLFFFQNFFYCPVSWYLVFCYVFILFSFLQRPLLDCMR